MTDWTRWFRFLDIVSQSCLSCPMAISSAVKRRIIFMGLGTWDLPSDCRESRSMSLKACSSFWDDTDIFCSALNSCEVHGLFSIPLSIALLLLLPWFLPLVTLPINSSSTLSDQRVPVLRLFLTTADCGGVDKLIYSWTLFSSNPCDFWNLSSD